VSCKAVLYIGDDFGDNHATMHCQLEDDHEPPHREKFDREGTDVVVTWFIDERETEEELEEA
jgi:hypothetical protein